MKRANKRERKREASARLSCYGMVFGLALGQTCNRRPSAGNPSVPSGYSSRLYTISYITYCNPLNISFLYARISR